MKKTKVEEIEVGNIYKITLRYFFETEEEYAIITDMDGKSDDSKVYYCTFDSLYELNHGLWELAYNYLDPGTYPPAFKYIWQLKAMLESGKATRIK